MADFLINQRLLVLAGGFGTRLLPAVSNAPKVLAPVGNTPFLQLLIENWVAQGVREFIFSLHHKSEHIEVFLNSIGQSGRFPKCSFKTLTESEPLGTGGAIALAVRYFQIDSPFLVVNADTWLESGIGELAATQAPAMAVVKVPNVSRYGSVEIQHGRVVNMIEKIDKTGEHWINAGLYHLTPNLFLLAKEASFSLERDLLPKYVLNAQVSAVPVLGRFIDIGVPEDYYQFCRWHESGKMGSI
jgi:D-glycero-alpha-D-manno-heptose 1-phosphate guanylyltransferase